MKKFLMYRNGASKMENRVKTAVKHFYQSRHRLPATVVVNPAEVDAARAACEALSLKVAVSGGGGCLSGELWLEVASSSDAGKLSDIIDNCAEAGGTQ